jgi:hypothetical protein
VARGCDGDGGGGAEPFFLYSKLQVLLYSKPQVLRNFTAYREAL